MCCYLTLTSFNSKCNNMSTVISFNVGDCRVSPPFHQAVWGQPGGCSSAHTSFSATEGRGPPQTQACSGYAWPAAPFDWGSESLVTEQEGEGKKAVRYSPGPVYVDLNPPLFSVKHEFITFHG